jgi:hypothetical protein
MPFKHTVGHAWDAYKHLPTIFSDRFALFHPHQRQGAEIHGGYPPSGVYGEGADIQFVQDS